MNNPLKIFVSKEKDKAKKKLKDPKATGIDAKLYQRRLQQEEAMKLLSRG